MQLKQFLGSDEDRAVSPVIGVVLMLTATVIIGGVVASFVTGMGSGMESAPQASFDFDYDGDNVTITHEGGATIAADKIVVKNESGSFNVADDSLTDVDQVSTGDVITVESVENGSTVRLVWESPDSDKTTQLGKWVGPNA